MRSHKPDHEFEWHDPNDPTCCNNIAYPDDWARKIVSCLESPHHPLQYDEEGSLLFDSHYVAPDGFQVSAGAHDIGEAFSGCWMLRLESGDPAPMWGTLRLDFLNGRIRTSGDMYLGRWPPNNWLTPHRLVIGKSWYPQFNDAKYRWYFRSRAVSYRENKLSMVIRRRLWNPELERFDHQDDGWFRFAHPEVLETPHLPQSTVTMKGEGSVGGVPVKLLMYKTSNSFRGCAVILDFLRRRDFNRLLQRENGQVEELQKLFQRAGMDLLVQMRRTHQKLKQGERRRVLTTRKLQRMMDRALKDKPCHQWTLWLLIGSRWRRQSLYGLMFDMKGRHREGVVAFYDAQLPLFKKKISEKARGKKLGEVAEAIFRTVCHEIGHAFNLVHPEEDIHSLPNIRGTELMNTTRMVIDQADESRKFPRNIDFSFHAHNRDALVHDPDPQVKPGGFAPFGQGHLDAPAIDKGGLLGRRAAKAHPGLRVSLYHPFTHPLDKQHEKSRKRMKNKYPDTSLHPGHFFFLTVELHNWTDTPIYIPTKFDLAHGDLTLTIKAPHRTYRRVTDIVIACRENAMLVLGPDETVYTHVQLYYTNHGFIFDRPGRYEVTAEVMLPTEQPDHTCCDAHGRGAEDAQGKVVQKRLVARSDAFPLTVTLPPDYICLDDQVGEAFAHGGFKIRQYKEMTQKEVHYQNPGHALYAFTGDQEGKPKNTLHAFASRLVLANTMAPQGKGEIEDKALTKLIGKNVDLKWGHPKKHYNFVAERLNSKDLRALIESIASPIEPDAPILNAARFSIFDPDSEKSNST